MNIRGIYKTSLIDFPGKICTVLFSGGCNLRCRYCHNPDLACGWQDLELSSNETALELLKKRKKVIDGVTLSGGEPTLSRNIEAFLENIKQLDLAVKLDSNGLQPHVIERLIDRGLLDYAAIDIKTSPQKYAALTNTEVDFTKIARSVELLRAGGIDHEVRTTCLPGYVTIEDLESIRNSIGQVKKYFLQQFQRDVRLLDRTWEVIEPYPPEVLFRFRDFILTFAERCEIRGI
ncbi:MAG: anaerobic ribonucleoside-triphosphate reductase activating protein [Spirochaetes bacterium]|nr:anaerobic ribonucleoside-triphosphate reductase activating protein [Spirochaetota bacterium]